MKQPKYSPEEALDRIKLMMKYDLSKTLNENKSTNVISEIAPLAVAGLVAGGAAAIGLFTAWATQQNTNVEGKVRSFFEMCKTEELKKYPRRINNQLTTDYAENLKNAVNDEFLNVGWGTNEDEINRIFSKVYGWTPSDFCALADTYYNNYGDNLYDDLSADLDSEKEWLPILNPIISSVNSAIEEANKTNSNQQASNKGNIQTITDQNGTITFDTDKSCGTSIDKVYVVFDSNTGTKYFIQPNQNGSGYSRYYGNTSNIKTYCGDIVDKSNKTTTSKYKQCDNQYTYGCVAPAIGQVQSCLGGLVIDNKFGPKTAEVLKTLGYTSFTDADIQTICSKKVQKTSKQGETDEFINKVDSSTPNTIINKQQTSDQFTNKADIMTPDAILNKK